MAIMFTIHQALHVSQPLLSDHSLPRSDVPVIVKLHPVHTVCSRQVSFIHLFILHLHIHTTVRVRIAIDFAIHLTVLARFG